MNSQLVAAAQRHANDILGTSNFSNHTGSDGSTSQSRIADAGYSPIGSYGEIQYGGTGATPEAAVNWWMNSPGHRAIILNCSLTDVGLASASNGATTTYVGDFAHH
jgi:uncharacterized protein YkwD